MNATGDLYHAVRAREGRLYADEVVASLPRVEKAHPHRAEWEARAASARRLFAYFKKRREGLRILDLGCGNGWLAAALARLPRAEVIGVDANVPELEQADRVFGVAGGAAFLVADATRPPFAAAVFDAVVMAATAQYFADLPALFAAVRPLLAPGGELHVLDSPFYDDDEVAAARDRSAKYYEGLGFPGMAARYHHHTWREMRDAGFTVLYDPKAASSRLRRRLGVVDSPFPWLRAGLPA